MTETFRLAIGLVGDSLTRLYLKFCKYICCHQDINISHPAIEILLAWPLSSRSQKVKIKWKVRKINLVSWHTKRFFFNVFTSFQLWGARVDQYEAIIISFLMGGPKREARIQCRLGFVRPQHLSRNLGGQAGPSMYLVLLSGTLLCLKNSSSRNPNPHWVQDCYWLTAVRVAHEIVHIILY